MIFDEVRYMDFDTDTIEKGHQHYSLFLKRKAFQLEQEVRATVLLKQLGKGQLVECDIAEQAGTLDVWRRRFPDDRAGLGYNPRRPWQLCRRRPCHDERHERAADLFVIEVLL